MKNLSPSLSEIFSNHKGKVSDKWEIYISKYDQLFKKYRNKPIRLLEIGVQNGGSLEVWMEYFKKAKTIIGSDINKDCSNLKFNNQIISIVVADANTDETEQKITSISKKLDIIIDDGSHESGDIVRSFCRYFKHIEDGGLYIAEDLHCSYWENFTGGLFQPLSSISFFKLLIDVLNHEHWGIEKKRTELLFDFNKKYNIQLSEDILSRIHSIEFFNSLCIIKKHPASENTLGRRLVSGEDAIVWDGAKLLHNSKSVAANQNSNFWSVMKIETETETETETSQKNKIISRINSQLIKIDSISKKFASQHASDDPRKNEKEIDEKILRIFLDISEDLEKKINNISQTCI